MVGFLGGAVPAVFAMVTLGLFRAHISSARIGRAALQGVAFFVLSYVVYIVLRPMVVLRFDLAGIYLYYLFHDNAFFLVWCLVSYLLLYGTKTVGQPIQLCARAFAYFAGFYTFLALSDMILNYNSLGRYVLFLLPVARISLIFISVAVIVLMARVRHWTRYLLIIVPPMGSAIASFAPFLVVQSRATGAILLSASIFAVSGCVFFLSART